jgi:hypothetical protein
MTMFRYERELDAIKKRLGRLGVEIDFRPANPGDIGYMQGMLYPDRVIEFYADAEPASWFDIEDVQLNSIADMWGENENALPGDRVVPLGLLNVASTDEGDTYCVDLNSLDGQDDPIVRWVSHNITETMTDDEVMDRTHVAANTFSDFLMMFATGELKKLPHIGHKMPPPEERTTFQPHRRAA